MANTPAPQKPVEGDKEAAKKSSSSKSEEIKNPHPLSEKDEVKEAERRLGEAQKKDGR